MGIFVAIPMTILAGWIIYKLYDYTERNSIKLIIFCGVLAAAGVLTAIICKFFGLDFYGSEIDEIDRRGAGPFRW
jgi:uncharacterized membrane protein